MGFFAAFSPAVGLFRVVFLRDKDTAKSPATPVFPKMLKIGQTGVFGLSDPVVEVLIRCLCVSASMNRCKP